MKKYCSHHFYCPVILSVMSWVGSSSVYSMTFEVGAVPVQLDTTVTAGISKRLEKQAPEQVSIASGGVGGSLNTDNGNLNFDEGDYFSKLVKGNSTLVASYKNYGVFARAKYWYDFELKDEMPTGNGGLSESGKKNASGAEFLDAYLWADYWLGEQSVSLRLGQQVASWGESTFIFNGVNVINPIDVSALRAPGAEVKDALLPVNMIHAAATLTDEISVEAFYQFEFEETRLEDCGTFFSSLDYVADGCNSIYLNPFDPTQQVSRIEDRSVEDNGQFGVALKWFVADWNDTELGAYYVNYHSRFPTVGGRVPVDPMDPFNPDHGVAYFIEYPEDIQFIGLSFNTMGPWGISLSGEYSFKQDAPVQLNAHDLIMAALVQDVSPVFQDRVPDLDQNGIIDGTDAFLAGFFGTEQSGYDLYNISQLQFTGIKFFEQLFGTERVILVAEVGATYIHGFDNADELGIRYGRNEQLGVGVTAAGPLVCAAVNPIVPADIACTDEGYTTQFSWGYRARASFKYTSVMNGLDLTPQITWSHDVGGFAPDPGGNFVAGRRSVGFALIGDYLNATQFKVSYTKNFGSVWHNYLVDRDHLTLSISQSF